MVTGLGLVIIIPLNDQGVKVNLNENIPGGQGLSKDELDKKIEGFVLNRFQT